MRSPTPIPRRRRVFQAFRLTVSLDRNAGQIRVQALVSSACTEARDLDRRLGD